MNTQPMADRLRPHSFDEMVGQRHLIGEHGILRRMLDCGRISNMIFSGPPGTGKTTLANIIAERSGMHLCRLNATTASLSDVRDAVRSTSDLFGSGGILLYLDEIQYFNRKQQQSLLEYMEDGRVVLISSTTENPYFAIYDAILSRSTVFEFKPVSPADCLPALRRALDLLNADAGQSVEASDEVLLSIASHSGGDVRRCINILENAYYTADGALTEETVSELFPSLIGAYQRDGDSHYDLLSCLQKSIRGSDPDASIFYLARLLASNELLAVCRRLQVIASEDIGAAYPMAAVITRACVESAVELGLPEAAIPLSNAVIHLATAPKSNSAHTAYELARADVEAGLGLTVPTHLQSPLFRGYKYPHDYPNNYVRQQYLPSDLKGRQYYQFGDNKYEQNARAYFQMIQQKSKPSDS